MEARVVIVGAGSIGRSLAERLRERYLVLLLDRERDRIARLDGYAESDLDVLNLSGQPGLVAVYGDGSSRMVLQTVYAADAQCALVAATGRDQANLEVARIAKDIGFDPVIALAEDGALGDRFAELRVTVVERTPLLVGEIERTLRHHGAIIPRGVGLGRGELVEIRLVRTSPILGRPLKALAPHRWRIAAIFRQDEVIVPVGETTLEVDDRVLLVGDPEVLSMVVEYLRLGKPQFPQPYGARILSVEQGGPEAPLLRDAEGLYHESTAVALLRGQASAERRGAGGSVEAGSSARADAGAAEGAGSGASARGGCGPQGSAGPRAQGGGGAGGGAAPGSGSAWAPGAAARDEDEAEELRTLIGRAKPEGPEALPVVALPAPGAPGFAEAVRAVRPGLVVIRPFRRGWWSRALGTRSPDSRLCDALACPVLFSRGSFPFRRILLPVSQSTMNLRSAELAIDLTRLLGARLTAMNVDLPQYVSGLEEEVVHDEVVPIRRLCELYEVPLEYQHRWGNPVRHLLDQAVRSELVVVARRRHRRDTYFEPDLALRLARAAPCSVLVLTIGEEGP